MKKPSSKGGPAKELPGPTPMELCRLALQINGAKPLPVRASRLLERALTLFREAQEVLDEDNDRVSLSEAREQIEKEGGPSRDRYKTEERFRHALRMALDAPGFEAPQLSKMAEQIRETFLYWGVWETRGVRRVDLMRFMATRAEKRRKEAETRRQKASKQKSADKTAIIADEPATAADD